jgi:3-phenylpropionate/trans-cinnamate dioxygenase ferredoxin reductase component
MADSPSFVIIGASLAGAKAAETLRTEGFDGRIVLVGEEPVRPYERPPLSKDYLRGEVGPDAAFVHDEGFYGEHDIELLTGTTASALDVANRQVGLDSGDTLGYDALLLTTGAGPRRLSIAGADLPGIHYLRTMEDADRLHEALVAGGPLVVIGAGWIGCEVAASARQMGVDVAVVEMGALPLERVLGPELGAFYRDVHVEHGVDFHFGVGIDSLQGRSKVEAVGLSDGSSLPANVVVVGVGVAPRVELAQAAGLTVDNGIVTDEYLAASAPGVYAAGDVASAWHPVLGRRIRLEHWSSALNQGPAAAKNMLGEPTPYTKIPYFYSDQYDVSMEYSGLATKWDDVVLRGDPATREFIVFWTEDHRVRAGMNVNVWDVNPAIAALVASGNPVDRDRLADPDVELASFAR